jgi:hypothetical protein
MAYPLGSKKSLKEFSKLRLGVEPNLTGGAPDEVRGASADPPTVILVGEGDGIFTCMYWFNPPASVVNAPITPEVSAALPSARTAAAWLSDFIPCIIAMKSEVAVSSVAISC